MKMTRLRCPAAPVAITASSRCVGAVTRSNAAGLAPTSPAICHGASSATPAPVSTRLAARSLPDPDIRLAPAPVHRPHLLDGIPRNRACPADAAPPASAPPKCPPASTALRRLRQAQGPLRVGATPRLSPPRADRLWPNLSSPTKQPTTRHRNQPRRLFCRTGPGEAFRPRRLCRHIRTSDRRPGQHVPAVGERPRSPPQGRPTPRDSTQRRRGAPPRAVDERPGSHDTSAFAPAASPR